MDPDVHTAARAYDSLAPRFDILQRENPVLAHSARASLALVQAAMSRSQFVLDIGCGTGREALELAALGKRVVACDPSRESLAILGRKAAARGLSHNIRTFALPASGIDVLRSEFGPHAFDGAYSSFALSYERSLDRIPDTVRSLLQPRSPFLCSLYNRLCLTEILLMAPLIVPRRALKRLEGATPLPVDRFEVIIRSSTPSMVRRTFDPAFVLEACWGIPAIVPPNYLGRLLLLSGSFRPAWEELDLRINGRWPFKHLGSHTAYLFRSRPEPSGT